MVVVDLPSVSRFHYPQFCWARDSEIGEYLQTITSRFPMGIETLLFWYDIFYSYFFFTVVEINLSCLSLPSSPTKDLTISNPLVTCPITVRSPSSCGEAS